MNRFELVRPRDREEARDLCRTDGGSEFKAGGIDLLDHMKEHLLEPSRVVDLKSIPGMDRIEVDPDGTLRLGALVSLSRVAADARIRQTHPALARACGRAASPQIRNVATIGGNVLQRPRCWYYRLESYRCLKKGGDFCYAVSGENRYHVIFGGGPAYATHPSNAAIALTAFGATFVLEGDRGDREVPAEDFFRLPDPDPLRENVLEDGEIMVGIRVPPTDPGTRSTYDDIREKAAFDWPLVSLAATLTMDGTAVRAARLVLGAVAPVPWRTKAAEEIITGRPLNRDTVDAAARAAVIGAEPLSQNAYRVALVRTLVQRTLLSLA